MFGYVKIIYSSHLIIGLKQQEAYRSHFISRLIFSVVINWSMEAQERD